MDRTEELLARLMGRLAERFKNALVLKGGMLLRLLNSPRATQDIDYCWVRTKKRNVLASEIREAVEQIEGLAVTDSHSNSRGVFLTVKDRNSGAIAKIEVNVVPALHRAPKALSTAPLANRYSVRAQVIATMDLSEALSHKIAATLERDLARDLYDLAQLEPLTSFDVETLQERLGDLEIRRAKKRAVDLNEAADLLARKLEELDAKKIFAELGGLVPPEHLPGLDQVIRNSVLRLIDRMRAHAKGG